MSNPTLGDTVILCDGCGWRADPNAPPGGACPFCPGELAAFDRRGAA